MESYWDAICKVTKRFERYHHSKLNITFHSLYLAVYIVHCQIKNMWNFSFISLQCFVIISVRSIAKQRIHIYTLAILRILPITKYCVYSGTEVR